MIDASNSRILQDATDNGVEDKIQLRGGDYEWTPPPTGKGFCIEGVDFIRTRLYPKGSIQPSYGSTLTKLKVIHDGGELPALFLRRCSYATFDQVHFISATHTRRAAGTPEAWDTLEHTGIGIQTSYEADGDNEYNVTFNKCYFGSFEVGVDVVAAGRKGINRLTFIDCTWDGNRYGLRGIRLDDMKIWGGMMQLSELALDLDGNNNRIRDLHFERNKQNWRVSYESHYNLLDTDSGVMLTNNLGYGTTVRNRARRNIEKKPIRKAA